MKTPSLILLALLSFGALAAETIIREVPISEAEFQRYSRNGELNWDVAFDFVREKCKKDERDGLSDAAIVTRAVGDSTWGEWISEFIRATPGVRHTLKCTVNRLTVGELEADRAEVNRLNRAEAARIESLNRDNPKSNLPSRGRNRRSRGSATSSQ